MRPLDTLGRVKTPDGKELVLYERAGTYHIRVDGFELMSSRAHGSEEDLAKLTCRHLAGAQRPRVLIGGLGFGYTVRAALEELPKTATVDIAEVFPAIVAWNRGPLAPLARRPLEDPRVNVIESDVGVVLERAEEPWDAILLDVDNGPEAFTLDRNGRLYTASGLDLLRRRLKPDGILGVWSADPSPSFVRLLGRAGFAARAVGVRALAGGRGPRHTIFIGRPASRPSG